MSQRSVMRAHDRRIEREDRRRRRLFARAGAAGGAVLGAVVLSAAPADAATFTVTSNADPGSGGCTTEECTLREAVAAADDADGADTVTFAADVTGAIDLTAGRVRIDDALTIEGPGAGTLAIDAGGDSRIFDFTNRTARVFPSTISGLTLRDGRSPIETYTYRSCIDYDYDTYECLEYEQITRNYGTDGGAIQASGIDLTVDEVVLADNVATSRGGALASDRGALTVTGSVVTDNSIDASGVDASTPRQAGGIYASTNFAGNIVVRDSEVTGNTAPQGGGIVLSNVASDETTAGAPVVIVQRTTVSGNTADHSGGGISVGSVAGRGRVVVEDSTISGNSAQSGGGIDHVAEGGVTVRNSTVSGNAASGDGGGLWLGSSDDVGSSIESSTVTGNTAVGSGDGVFRFGADDVSEGVDALRLDSTVVSGNGDVDLAERGDEGYSPLEGSFVLSSTLVEDPGTATTTEDPSGSNIIGQAALLGPLADNGGPTQTHEPAATSPVIDAGVANGLMTDQRGLFRTQDVPDREQVNGSDGTDIGAFERQVPPADGSAQPDPPAPPSVPADPDPDLVPDVLQEDRTPPRFRLSPRSTRRVSTAGTFPFAVSGCGNEKRSCTGGLVFSTGRGANRASAARGDGRAVVARVVRFTLRRRGGSRLMRVKLNRRGRSLLRRRGRLTVRVRGVLRDRAGNRTRRTARIVLRAPAARRSPRAAPRFTG